MHPSNHAPRHGSRARAPVDGEPPARRPGGHGASASRPSGCASGTSPTACTCRPGSRRTRGTLVDLPETLRPLSFAREYLNSFHGLTHNTALTNGDSEGCGHGQGSASFLTGAQAYKTQDAVRVDISADQLYARHVGDAVRFPSLELGCESARSGNAFGYSGTYKTHISWRTPTSPAPYEMNPKLVFDRLFTRGGSSLTQATVADRDFYRKSMLDYVMDDADRVRGRVAQDRSAQAGPVPDRRPRGRTSHPERRALRRTPRGRLPATARRHPGRLRRAPAPDVRPDGAGLPDRQHPGVSASW